MATDLAPTQPRTGDAIGTGRRKTAIARVRIRSGNGNITINGRPMEEYFLTDKDRRAVLEPMSLIGEQGGIDVVIRCDGGGIAGQAQACKLGIARALRQFAPELDETLRHSGFLTRDSRMKERKKYGLRGARRGTQFSKR